jgi:signal transduction histidine kinase
MKLLTKTTLYFLLAMVPLLAAGGFLLFRQFSEEINKRVDRELLYDEVQWVQYLETVTAGGTRFILQTPDLLIVPVRKSPARYPSISDVYGTKAKENTTILFRQLSHIVNINGTPYQIVIRKSQEQKAILVTNIASSMLLVFGGLFLATIIFNWIISKGLWQPFKASLHKIRNIELQKMESLYFEETNIEEFNELNTSLNTMTHKIRSDYENIKEFTENAAHEMQTPLAVAQTKMELLLQDDNLNHSQIESVMQATTALNRLSKLNQSLLLLAKIENNQYQTEDDLNLTEATKKYLALFDEIIKDKRIQVETSFEEDFVTRLHPFLADSLVSNLVGNAIKYNTTGGKINVLITGNQFCISNTSSLPAIQPQQLFRRFGASVVEKESSTGLGLAIVKKIVDTHQLSISYQYEDSFHRFCIDKK